LDESIERGTRVIDLLDQLDQATPEEELLKEETIS